MVGVFTKVESLNTTPPNVIVVAAATPTDILPNRRDDGRIWLYRFIQNLTGAELYVGVDFTADIIGADNYHFVLEDRQQFTVPSTGRVSVYSVAGGKVSTAEFEKVRF